MKATDRVLAGAAFLDENVPDWLDRIDPSTLAINTTDRCPLGQLFDDYWAGKNELGINADESLAFGFLDGQDSAGDDVTGDVLDREWRTLIEMRRADIATAPEPQALDTDEFIKNWAGEFQEMYEQRTAGGHSFTGIVASLLMDLRQKGVQIP